MVGDRIKDEADRRGLVTNVTLYRGSYDLIIRWDEGVVRICNPSTDSFTLISRRPSY